MQAALPLARAVHVLAFLLGGVANAALDLILTALASTFVPPSAQGRLFAALAITRYAGAIAANLGAAALYEFSMERSSELPLPLLLGGGALPLTLLAPFVLANTLALGCCALAPSASRPPHAKGAAGLAGAGATDDEMM